MTRVSRVAAFVGLGWPLASHAAALAGQPGWMPTITAVAAIVLLTTLGMRSRGRLRAMLTGGVLAVALVWLYAPGWLVFLPPAAINVALGCFFASTLRTGHEPRIARYARLERGGDLPDDLALYARRLTWIWSAWFFAAATLSIVLAVAAPLAVWSAFANVGSYLAVAVLFVGEYLFRRVRFPHHEHAPLAQLLVIVANDRTLPLHKAGR